MTIHGEAEAAGVAGKATFVSYAKPFKSLFKLTRPDGSEITAGFDGKVSWVVTPQGASLDKDTPVESVRRDADLQYALHHPAYFKELKLAGVTDFEGHRCYWLHGTTHWGKETISFTMSKPGCWSGIDLKPTTVQKRSPLHCFRITRISAGHSSPRQTFLVTGDQSQTFTYKTISHEPVADSIFELPEAVKALLKSPESQRRTSMIRQGYRECAMGCRIDLAAKPLPDYPTRVSRVLHS